MNIISYKQRKKLVGRGIGSGHGKSSCRGTKGQKSRGGSKFRANFEGGQTPLVQRLPKYRGFRPPNALEVQIVKLGDLEKLKEKIITKDILKKHGLIRKTSLPVKILNGGKLTKSFEIQVEKASKSAIEIIGKTGGSFKSSLQP